MDFSLLWWEKEIQEHKHDCEFPLWWSEACLDVQQIILQEIQKRERTSTRARQTKDAKSLRDSGLNYPRWYIKKKLRSRPRKMKNYYLVDARGATLLLRWKGK